MSITAKNLPKEEYFYGHKACAGCGGSLAVRNALKVLGQNAVAVLPAGCMSAVGFNFPQLCFSNNAIISTFAGTASMLTGQEKYLGGKVKRKFGVSSQHYSFAVKAFVEMVKRFNTYEYEFAVRETKTCEVIEDVSTQKSEIGILYLSDFNRHVMQKLFQANHLEFHKLMDCGVYVYLWKGHPLAERESIDFAELEQYPCLTFEQGDKSSFYFAEEIYSTNDYARVIKAADRSTMLNLMKGLNGYTFCSGIICGSLNGSDYTAVALKDSSDSMEIGYITKKNTVLSDVGRVYIEELEKYLGVKPEETE